LSRANGFTVLRLLCAFLVLFTHSYVITKQGAEPLFAWTHLIPFSALGVDGFFAISGYLVGGSLLRDPRPLAFLRNRALRVYPALIVLVLLLVFVLGPLMTVDPAYWSSPVTWKFLWVATLYGYHEYIAGLFQANPVHVVDGSLWTLPIEFTCYLALLTLSWSRALSARTLVALIALMVTLYVGEGFQPLHFIFQMELFQLNRFGILFFGGALLAVLGDRVPYHPPVALAIAAMVAALLFLEPRWQISIPPYLLAMPYLLVTLARSLKPFAWANRYDASYGFYLYAFPIQQVLETLNGASMGPRRLTLYATPIALACGLASWLLIERPALRFKAGGKAAAPP
jgi:peptidoglycan/LPS O-acetylase OafA/YrhL